jgi:phosphatidylglycerophosphate synthase
MLEELSVGNALRDVPETRNDAVPRATERHGGRSLQSPPKCGSCSSADGFDPAPNRYPISRWYVRPLAGRLAGLLTPTRVRPVHVTLCGLLLSMAGAATLAARPALAPLAAGLVLAGWFCDRLDGQLARRQGTVTRWGGWLDGNVDELADLALQSATAWAAARGLASSLPWLLLVAFLAGKYLFVYGLNLEEHLGRSRLGRSRLPGGTSTPGGTSALGGGLPGSSPRPVGSAYSLRTLWHLPGNADIRLHLLILALLSGWLTVELAVVAVYYNLRWIASYLLVARRLGGER